MSKKRLLLLAGIILVLGILALVATKFSFKSEKIRAKRGDVVEAIYGLGTVSADITFNVRVGVAVTVSKLFVKEGDRVTRGKPIIHIDESVMRSPIEGTVTRIAYKEGELVAPQIPMLTITNLDFLYLEVSLEQQSVLRVKERQSVTISFETLRNEKFTGLVKAVYPRENQFIVRIELEDWPPGVLPGMTADTAIIVGQKQNVLLLPIKSISSGKVTRLRNGNKEKVPVKLGVIDNEWAEIVSDNISETDEILLRKK